MDLPFDPGSSCSETITTAPSLKCNPWMTRQNPPRPTVPLSACRNRNLLWIKSKGSVTWCCSPVWIKSDSAYTSRQLGPRPFCAVVDIKRNAASRHFNPRNLLSYLSDITASGVISRGPYGSNRDAKGQAAPKYHKRMRGYEHALTESKGNVRGWKKKLKYSLGVVVAVVGLAPFPPKKRRVKRWTLYKWNSISRHIILPCSLSWLSFSLRPETIIN